MKTNAPNLIADAVATLIRNGSVAGPGTPQGGLQFACSARRLLELVTNGAAVGNVFRVRRREIVEALRRGLDLLPGDSEHRPAVAALFEFIKKCG